MKQMKRLATKCSVLWSMNLVLLCCLAGMNFMARKYSVELEGLQNALKRLNDASELQRTEFDARMEANIQAQEARIAQRDFVIGQLRQKVDELSSLVESEDPFASGSDMTAEAAGSAADETLGLLTSRPKVQEIPIMSREEFRELRQRRRQMPWKLPQRVLLNGDVESVLRDPQWNPSGGELNPEERANLGVLLHDYRFFLRTSKRERVENVIIPEVELMREHGAYIEYPAGTAPPRIEGVSISHAETSEDRSTKRLYPFYEADYPELYHATTVEYQRELEAFVRIYELINGPS